MNKNRKAGVFMAKKKKTKVRETTKKPVAKKKKKRKILYGRILFACLFLAVIAYGVIYFLPQNIRSITVSGNDYLTEQEVIELAKLESYPSTYTNYGYKIKVELEKSPFIKKASVSKKWIFQVAIQIEENRPIFYDITKKKAVLEDGETIDGDFEIPLLINYTPDKIYQKLITKMSGIDTGIIRRISEMKYDPNEVDPNRFLFTMDDGNYVYLTVNKLNNLNSYLTIMEKFEGKKGILYLDSGEYFKVLEG